MTENDAEVLTKAKDARNFIAHDAKDLGDLYSVSSEGVAEFIDKLRTAVADVAAGDNFISKIVYRINERWEPIPHAAANYADVIDLWVFGHIIRNREPALWSLLFHQGLPTVPPAPPRVIRLPRAALRPPSPLPSQNKRTHVKDGHLATPSADP
jgi:hypothetical protein